MSQTTHTITDLREAMFAQLKELRATPTTDAEQLKAAISKAGAVSDLAKAITDTARVENEFLELTGGQQSTFLGGAEEGAAKPNGITGVVRHRLVG